MAETKASTRGSRVRQVVYACIVLQMIGVAVFVASLLVGEQNRVTLLALYLPRWPFVLLAIVMALLVRYAGRNVRVMLPVQLGICLVLLFPVLGFSTGSSRQGERPIHFASYNIYFGKLNRPELIEEIVRMPA